MGKLHDNWKNFKKSHPAFDKAKKPSADLGKHLDDYEKAMREIFLAFRKVSPQASTAMSALVNINKILLVYSKVIDEVAKDDKTIIADFKKLGLGKEELHKRLDEIKDMAMFAVNHDRADP